MTGAFTCEMDLKRLTELISSLHGALLGTGQSGPGDAAKLLKNEAGQLAWEISKQLGPETEKKGKAGVLKDMKNVFFPLNPYTPKGGFSGNRIGTQPDFLWLFAYGGKGMGRETSFLVGADTDDVRLTGEGDLPALFYKKANRTRGSAWQDLGEYSHSKPDKQGRMRPHFKRWRGAQHAVKINRIVITKQVFERTRRFIEKNLGQLRASFARTAQECAEHKRIPKWVKDQIQNCISNGKSIFEPEGLKHPTAPFIAFGSRAVGVESNPYIAEKIHGAVVTRQQIIVNKLGKVLSGYKMDLERGTVFKSKVNEGDE